MSSQIRKLEKFTDHLNNKNIICFNAYEKFAGVEDLGVLEPKFKELIFHNSVPHPATLINKGLLTKKPYDISYKITADYDFFLFYWINNKNTFVKIDRFVSTHLRGGASSCEALARSEIYKIKVNNLGEFMTLCLEVLLRIRRIIRKIL